MKEKEETKAKKTRVKKETTTKAKTKEKKTEKVKKETTKEKKVKKANPAIVKEEKIEKKVIEEKKDSSDALLNLQSQKNLRVLSKIIYVLTKIARVFLMIAVPFIFVAMIAIPFLIKKIEVNGNIIKFSDASIIVNDDYVTFKVADNDYVSDEKSEELVKFFKYITDNDKNDVLLVTELSLGYCAIMLVISIYIMMCVEKFFKNINTKETPFIIENANYIRRVGYLQIISVAVSFILQIVINSIIVNGFMVNFNTVGIYEILVVFIAYYVFSYAVKLQEKSKSKIYN